MKDHPEREDLKSGVRFYEVGLFAKALHALTQKHVHVQRGRRASRAKKSLSKRKSLKQSQNLSHCRAALHIHEFVFVSFRGKHERRKISFIMSSQRLKLTF